MNTEETKRRTQLDKSWYSQEGRKAYELDIVNDYISGASDFQKQAIKVLSRQRALSAGSVNYEAYHNAIEIIKALKADIF